MNKSILAYNSKLSINWGTYIEIIIYTIMKYVYDVYFMPWYKILIILNDNKFNDVM